MTRLVGWVLFVVCFMATLEVSCRIEQWWLYGAPILGLYTYDSALFTTDEYGIRGKAHGVYEKWRLNSYGFRGPEVQPVKVPRLLRVGCIGASETFGLYESQGNEWPRQLESLLRGGGIEAEVINAAIAGMSLPQRTLHVRHRLLPLQPDVVVFMLEYGSYAGMTEQRVKARIGKPAGVLGQVDALGGLKTLRTVGRIKDLFLPKLPGFVQHMLERLEREAKLRILERQLDGKFQSYTHVTPLEIDVFAQDLLELFQITEAAGIRLILVSPAMWFTERNLSITSLSWPYLHESWWREAAELLPPTARAFARTHDLSYVDLNEVVHSHEAEWMMDMLHFNNHGASKVAARLSQEILKQPFVYAHQ